MYFLTKTSFDIAAIAYLAGIPGWVKRAKFGFWKKDRPAQKPNLAFELASQKSWPSQAFEKGHPCL